MSKVSDTSNKQALAVEPSSTKCFVTNFATKWQYYTMTFLCEVCCKQLLYSSNVIEIELASCVDYIGYISANIIGLTKKEKQKMEMERKKK